jgi:hypothetical protein
MPSFLAPLFLLGMAAAAVPIALHLLKRRPETRVKFPAVRLLRNAPVERTSRRRLRELWLLALRVAALVLLSLAFARPFFAGATVTDASGITMIALDTSLSMSAPGQFERARQLAREAIDAAPASHLVGVVTFGSGTDVLAPPSADRGMAASAVDRARAGTGRARYRQAVAAALAGIEAQTAEGAIVVVTDLQASGWGEGDQVTVPASVTVRVADVGAPPPNAAVIAARATSGSVVATVRNAAPESRSIVVRMTVDGRPAGRATTRVEANGTADVTLPAPGGREAVVEVDDETGVAGDNRQYVILSDRADSIAVVTSTPSLAREGFFVQQALLASAPGATAPSIEGVAATDLAQWDAARLGRHAAVIVLSTRGLDRRGRDLLEGFLARGGGLMLAAGPDVDADVARDLLGGVLTMAVSTRESSASDRRLVPADLRHPVFRAFEGSRATLGSVVFDRIATLGGDGCDTLARFTTGEPALVECVRGQGRVLVFASDLGRAWNDFPRHATFVAFLHEAVSHLAGSRRVTSGFLVDDRPAGVPAEPGFATLPAAVPGGGDQRVTVNVDPDETVAARLTPDTFAAAIFQGSGSAELAGAGDGARQEAGQQVWWYLVLAMFLVLAAEGWVGARAG